MRPAAYRFVTGVGRPVAESQCKSTGDRRWTIDRLKPAAPKLMSRVNNKHVGSLQCCSQHWVIQSFGDNRLRKRQIAYRIRRR